MLNKKYASLAIIWAFVCTYSFALEAPLVSIKSQDEFFIRISQLCGKAYEGNIIIDNTNDITNKKLVMHIRKWSNEQLQIPFHIGNDASRTWIISKTGYGLSLKHDHRQQDGSYHQTTIYGGHTIDGGWAEVQSFPADQYSKELFITQGIPQSIGNIWQVYVYGKKFTYRLVRQGREFRVDFDLTKPVSLPVVPWGYE